MLLTQLIIIGHAAFKSMLCVYHANDAFIPMLSSYRFVLFYFWFSGTHVDMKQDVLVARSGEYRTTGSGRGRHFSTDNGECYY